MSHCNFHVLALTAGLALMTAGVLPGQDPTIDADQIDAIVRRGIDAGEMPGAVVVVADQQRVLFQKAYGHRQIEPNIQPMTLDTVFDLASLTKPIATATSVMRLVRTGKIDVDQSIAHYLPEFSSHDKDEITVADLLTHVGGLIPDNALRDYDNGIEQSWKRICDLKPRSPRGEKFAYTDVGFIVLGKLVQQVSGKSLDQFARDEVFEPLGMQDTGFNPAPDLVSRTAPTEKRDSQWIKAKVHDPRAFRLDGVAGHAGLFSTASDLVLYGQMMLGQGTLGDVTTFDRATFTTFTKPRTVPRGSRTFGWDHQSPYSSNRGESFSDTAFGHGGFTGTVMWIDPEKDLVFIFLSNRLHPDGKGSVNRLAGEIATIIGR
ncbi:MAG: serine hydrolase domain-containing protein [Rubripirellula sp.]